jgi:hypothetical protein
MWNCGMLKRSTREVPPEEGSEVTLCHEYVAAWRIGELENWRIGEDWRRLEKFWRLARDAYGVGTATSFDIFSAY